MKLKVLVALWLFMLGGFAAAPAQEAEGSAAQADSVQTVLPPAPVTDLAAEDIPDDHGHAIKLSWNKSADDAAGQMSVTGYVIMMGLAPDGEFTSRDTIMVGATEYSDIGSLQKTDGDYIPDHTDLYYKVRALTANPDVFTDSEIFGPVQSSGQWFNVDRLPVLLMVAAFLFFTLYFIRKARGGSQLYVRRLAGIEAVDEAIGRATEMGKPILYVLGLGTAADIATIASYTILGRVAKKVAEYQTGLIVPCYDPIVMTVAQETVKTAYLDAGRPDAYNEDMVYFVTNQQFAYVAGVNGVMMRELPATNLYMGKFYAESLILAETGAVAGSIQISGTDEISQIPFFVVACDYTLIGEELYAASAYLGREPLLLGSLKAQDYAKAGVIILAIIGFISLLLDYHGFIEFFHVTK